MKGPVLVDFTGGSNPVSRVYEDMGGSGGDDGASAGTCKVGDVLQPSVCCADVFGLVGIGSVG